MTGAPDAAAPAARGADAAGPSVSSCTISAATGERSVVSTNARARPDPAPLSALSDTVAAGAPAPDVVLIDGHNPLLACAGLDIAERVGALRLMDAGSWKDDAADLPGRCDVVAPSARFHPPGPAGVLREPADVAAWLRGRGAGAVVLTHRNTPILWWCGERSGSAAPPAIEAVDTLGAGDVFHGALALALLLPLTFYLARIDVHWTALRLLSIGLGWAAATLGLFTAVSSRPVDRRLAASGASPTALVAGRLVAILALGWTIAGLYAILVQLTIGDKLIHPAAVAPMLLVTVAVAAPLGPVAAALVPRDLEGALLLLAVMALQLLVDPTADWTRVLPLWSTRELSSYIVEELGSGAGDYLWRGLTHGAGFAVGLTALT